MFIGVSGVAGSGKDLFVEKVIEFLTKLGKKAKRFALADGLKEDARLILIQKYGIDPTNCSREEKDKIRPDLVKIAQQKREESEGRYWINKLEVQMKSSEPCDYYCISDIRFAEYERDEVFWLKKEKQGILVHVSKYFIENGSARVNLPANEAERKNDPVLLDEADYHVLWQHGCKHPENEALAFIERLLLNEEKKREEGLGEPKANI